MLVEEAAEPATGDDRVAPVTLQLDLARLRAGQLNIGSADGGSRTRTGVARP
jgi:hypothetical protein